MSENKPIRLIRPHQPFSYWLQQVWLRRETLWFFVWKDLKVQYEKPILGLLWSLFQPLVYFAVILAVVRFSGRTGTITSMPFELYLLCGLAIWNFTASSITGAINSLQSNAGMVSKAAFPRLYIVLSPLLRSLFDLSMMVAIVFITALFLGVNFSTLTVIHLLSAFVLIIPVSFGLACISISAIVAKRHFRHVIPILLYAAIFALPVFYAIGPDSNKWMVLIYQINPVAGAMTLFRSAFNGLENPLLQVTIWMSCSLLLACIGIIVFRKTERTLADRI